MGPNLHSYLNDAVMEVFFPQMRNIPSFPYNWVSSVVTQNAGILNFVYIIFNLRDTEVIICILLFY